MPENLDRGTPLFRARQSAKALAQSLLDIASFSSEERETQVPYVNHKADDGQWEEFRQPAPTSGNSTSTQEDNRGFEGRAAKLIDQFYEALTQARESIPTAKPILDSALPVTTSTVGEIEGRNSHLVILQHGEDQMDHLAKCSRLTLTEAMQYGASCLYDFTLDLPDGYEHCDGIDVEKKGLVNCWLGEQRRFEKDLSTALRRIDDEYRMALTHSDSHSHPAEPRDFGMTASEAQKLLGIAQGTFSKWKNGDASPAGWDSVSGIHPWDPDYFLKHEYPRGVMVFSRSRIELLVKARAKIEEARVQKQARRQVGEVQSMRKQVGLGE